MENHAGDRAIGIRKWEFGSGNFEVGILKWEVGMRKSEKKEDEKVGKQGQEGEKVRR
jgi:hypothetical protein